MKKNVPLNLDLLIENIGTTLFSGLRSVTDKIHNPKRVAIYFSTMLIGLSASRLANSVIMYNLSSKLQAIAPSASVINSPRRSVTTANFDLSSVIDGVFFHRPTVESKTPEFQNTPELKNFSLIGTLEGDPSFARAVIRIQGSKDEPQEYAIGEKIGAAVLIAIGFEKIWIRLNGEKLKIEIGESVKDQQGMSSASTAGATEVSKVISRQEINEKILGNPAAIYGGGAAFGPNLVNGKIEGFRLHRVPENHIFYTLGARSGDIIKSVNGYALSNTSQMMELWNNIKTMPHVSVDVIRGGKPMKFDFEIRN